MWFLSAFQICDLCNLLSLSKQILIFVPNVEFVILVSFLKEGHINLVNIRPSQTWICFWQEMKDQRGL